MGQIPTTTTCIVPQGRAGHSLSSPRPRFWPRKTVWLPIAAPASSSQHAPDSRHRTSEPPPPERVSSGVPRPVDRDGLAPDLFLLHVPPVPAVLRVGAIVAHHEVRVWRHGRRLAPIGVGADASCQRIGSNS